MRGGKHRALAVLVLLSSLGLARAQTLTPITVTPITVSPITVMPITVTPLPPATLPECLIQFGERDISIEGTPPPIFSWSALVLLHGDGTFQEIQESRTTPAGGFNDPLVSGTYKYNLIGYGGNGPGVVQFSAPLGPNQNSFALQFNTATAGIFNVAPFALGTFTIYPLQTATAATNLSNLQWVLPGHSAITGLVLNGPSSRWVLVRAVGPGLQSFGMSPAVSAPILSVFQGPNLLASFGAWTANGAGPSGITTLFILVGAFPLAPGSNDCAALVLLPPGNFSLVVSSGSDQGSVLCEAYFLPYY